jgi:hypothetical protein
MSVGICSFTRSTKYFQGQTFSHLWSQLSYQIWKYGGFIIIKVV